MGAVANGDSDAFAELYQRHQQWIKAFLWRQGAPRDAIDELTQESFMVAWKRAAWFDGQRAQFRTWLTVIARNRCIDQQRRIRPVIAQTDSWISPSSTECPHTSAVSRQSRAAIRRALPALSEVQRVVIEGAYFDAKPLRIIAEEQGVPLGTIKSRIRLALGALRLMMSPQYAAA